MPAACPKRYDYMDLFYIMEQLTTLRPTVVQSLLEVTQHYRIRRLFLYMADIWLRKQGIRGLRILTPRASILGHTNCN